MKPIRSAAVLLCLVTAPTVLAQQGAAPAIHEDGWFIESNFAFSNPVSALINPDDGQIYLGARSGGLYHTDAVGNSELLLATSNIAGIAYDPSTGALFFSEDYPGNIKRADIDPTTGIASVQAWVTGFHSGDDDPAGIARVPPDYTGSLLTPGQMVSTDRGYNGAKEIWAWSPAQSENEILIRDDNATLLDPVDIAVKGDIIAIADSNGGLKRLHDDGSVAPLPVNDAALTNVQGIVFDTRSDDLLVLDTGLDAIFRIDAGTGSATLVFDQLGTSAVNWGGINIEDDGTTQRVVISAGDSGRVYVFSITPPCSDADLAGPFGQLNFFDVSAFLGAFGAMTATGDWNHDGQWNFFDVSGFLSAFGAGCP